MKKHVRLNPWQEVGVFAQHFGIRELAYFRQLSCECITSHHITNDNEMSSTLTLQYLLSYTVHNWLLLLLLFGPGNGSPMATNVVVLVVLLLVVVVGVGVVVIRFAIC